MTQLELRTLVLSVENIDESLPFYEQTMGMPLKFRDGDHYAALDGDGVTLALATESDHPAPGEVALSFRTDNVPAASQELIEGGARLETPPTEAGHEMRAVLRDTAGNAVVVYGPKRSQ